MDDRRKRVEAEETVAGSSMETVSERRRRRRRSGEAVAWRGATGSPACPLSWHIVAMTDVTRPSSPVRYECQAAEAHVDLCLKGCCCIILHHGAAK